MIRDLLLHLRALNSAFDRANWPVHYTQVFGIINLLFAILAALQRNIAAIILYLFIGASQLVASALYNPCGCCTPRSSSRIKWVQPQVQGPRGGASGPCMARRVLKTRPRGAQRPPASDDHRRPSGVHIPHLTHLPLAGMLLTNSHTTPHITPTAFSQQHARPHMLKSSQLTATYPSS
jgi:hypothetical protein